MRDFLNEVIESLQYGLVTGAALWLMLHYLSG